MIHFLNHWRNLIGYVFLTLGVLLALSISLHEASLRTDQIVGAVKASPVSSCEGRNALRREIRIINQANEKALKGYTKRGLLTQKEFMVTVADSADAIRRLGPADCNAGPIKG